MRIETEILHQFKWRQFEELILCNARTYNNNTIINRRCDIKYN